jgi:hypothetical protein
VRVLHALDGRAECLFYFGKPIQLPVALAQIASSCLVVEGKGQLK